MLSCMGQFGGQPMLVLGRPDWRAPAVADPIGNLEDRIILGRESFGVFFFCWKLKIHFWLQGKYFFL